jgi:hypothetical protein
VFSRTLVGLGIVQLGVVGAVNLRTFASTRNPDDISGTFGTNAYQLVYLLLIVVVLVIGIATFEPGTATARFAIPLVTAFAAVMLLAQYRALIVSTLVALLAVGFVLKGRARGIAAVSASILVVVALFSLVATQLPFLKLGSAARSIVDRPREYAAGRGQVIDHVFSMYADLPETMVIGSGPGTYSSRAWQTFASADSGSRSNVAGGYAMLFTSGEEYSTDVSEAYVVPQIQQGAIREGSRAISNPYSSYGSLLAEVGVLGAALLVALYLSALVRSLRMSRHTISSRSSGDPLPALALATFVAFLTIVQMALLENWFEVSRMTFLIWIMLAVCARELTARDRR